MQQRDIAPATTAQRHLTGLDLGLVWFGAAIAIGEIWAGGLPGLAGLGLAGGLIAIVLGRLVGNGLMAAMARIGAATGLPTMVLTRPAFGVRGSYLPALLNVLQLIGWTGFMLFIGAVYMDILAAALGLPTIAELPAMRAVWVVLLGALCTLWAVTFAGQKWWKVLERTSSILLFLLTVMMSIIVLLRYGRDLSWTINSPLGILAGMDLVVAMSVSWLPLVADYSRYAVSPRAGAAGTFWGYFVGGVWMYAVGLLVAVASGTDDAGTAVIELFGGWVTGSSVAAFQLNLPWMIAGVLLVLLSTATTTFLDIYSAVVSAESLWPRIPSRAGSIIVGALGIMIALGFTVEAYEPFLLAIGAVFLPAFTVVLTDWYVLRRIKRIDGSVAAASSRRDGTGAEDGGKMQPPQGSSVLTHLQPAYPGSNWRAMLAWLVGFLVYDWAQGFPSLLFFYNTSAKFVALFTGSVMVVNPPMPTFPYGASLPCILVTGAVYVLLMSPVVKRAQVAHS